MSSGLTDRDTDAISTAVRILDEAGYAVREVGDGKRSEGGSGVEFRLEVEAPTRGQWFGKQAEGVREAAIDAPEFGLGGQEVIPDD